MENVNKVKEQRQWIDELIDGAKQLATSREIALCVTQLQRGKMWLGQSLKALNEKNPYPESSNPMSQVIEPQADRGKGYAFPPELENDHVGKVKAMRAGIDAKIMVAEELQTFGQENDSPLLYMVSCSQSWISLVDAKMWLGMELDRIRG